MKKAIRKQKGNFIVTLHPEYNAQAIIYSEEQRQMILRLISHNFIPDHTAIGKGKTTRKHWSVEKYNQPKLGKGFKMITTSPYSRSLNHITYFKAI